MRVLVISHTYITQINRKKWVDFSKHYPKITLLVLSPQTWKTSFFDIETKNSKPLGNKNCSFVTLPTYFTGNELLYFYKPLQFLHLLRKFKPDIIHVEQGLHALSYFQALLCNKIFKIKAKCSFFTWINWQAKLSLKMKVFTKFFGAINAAGSSGAITGNAEAKKILTEKYTGFPITVLPQLGVDTTLFKPAQKHDEADSKKYITFVGRVIEEKGLRILVKAFCKLAHQFQDWNLLIVGSGDLEKELIDFSISKKLLNRIEFQDPVEHEKIVPVMQKTDIFVLPSLDTPHWKEQFGHVLIEAMACRICVIGSNAGEIPNVIANNEAIFEQGNETSLYEILHKLITHPELRKKIAVKGFYRVNQEYTHEIIARKTFQFWQQLYTK